MELTLTYTTANNKPLNLKIGHEFRNNVGYVILKDTNIPENLFAAQGLLTSVTIPNGVTSIEDYAFWECPNLVNITIPNSMWTIGDWALAHTGITKINIPNSVEIIGRGAFCDCKNLTNLEIPNSVCYIGPSAFRNCIHITNIKIPNRITRIELFTFSCCDGLTSVEIPNSVTYIRDHAFAHCPSLTSVKIPDSVIDIEDFAFKGCRSLPCWQINPTERPILAYKGFDKNMSCRQFKYKIGKSYHEDKAQVCNCGFHACFNPIDVLNYYPSSYGSHYALVELSGTIDFSQLFYSGEDTKLSATDIKIIKELSFKDLIQEFNRLNSK